MFHVEKLKKLEKPYNG
ncbi:unnamed protein product, partial [Allacma fusca]